MRFINSNSSGLLWLKKWSVLCMFVFLFWGCDFDNMILNYTANRGYIDAEMNGEAWHVESWAPIDDSNFEEILIQGSVFNESTHFWESIYITFLNILNNDSISFENDLVNDDREVSISFHIIYDEMDVLYESYRLLIDSTNFVNLIVTGDYKELEAEFEFKLVKIQRFDKEDSPYSDTLIFQSGYILSDLR